MCVCVRMHSGGDIWIFVARQCISMLLEQVGRPTVFVPMRNMYSSRTNTPLMNAIRVCALTTDFADHPMLDNVNLGHMCWTALVARDVECVGKTTSRRRFEHVIALH